MRQVYYLKRRGWTSVMQMMEAGCVVCTSYMYTSYSTGTKYEVHGT